MCVCVGGGFGQGPVRLFCVDGGGSAHLETERCVRLHQNPEHHSFHRANRLGTEAAATHSVIDRIATRLGRRRG